MGASSRSPAATSAPLSAEERARRDTLMLVALWFVAAFTLYSAMVTKFDHYVFPAVPAAAILIGVVLDRMLGPAPSVPHAWATRLLAWIAPLPLLIGIGGLRGDLRGMLPSGLSAGQRAVWALQNGMSPVPCAVLIGLGAAVAVVRGRARSPPARRARPSRPGALGGHPGLGARDRVRRRTKAS